MAYLLIDIQNFQYASNMLSLALNSGVYKSIGGPDLSSFLI